MSKGNELPVPNPCSLGDIQDHDLKTKVFKMCLGNRK